MSRRGPLKGDPIAAAAIVLTIVTGVGVLQGGDAPVGTDKLRCVRVPAGKRQVEVKSNDPCYVCHMPFIQESLAVAHAKAKVWCGTCHGPSIRHIEDENIGATPPDIVYKKGQIDRTCGECHELKKHPKTTVKTRRARLAAGKKAQREIKGRKIKVAGVCTDCHGRHWIPPREQ